jgi:hypothetical protein
MPNAAFRTETASRANEIGRLSRNGGAPVLTADSGPESIADWLQWCDPNGSHTAELAEKEGFDPYDLETAWDVLARMIEDSGS